MLSLPIHAAITQEAMRTRLTGAHAGDAVLPERPRRPRRHLLTRAFALLLA
jgi:hypothetical protein